MQSFSKYILSFFSRHAGDLEFYIIIRPPWWILIPWAVFKLKINYIFCSCLVLQLSSYNIIFNQLVKLETQFLYPHIKISSKTVLHFSCNLRDLTSKSLRAQLTIWVGQHCKCHILGLGQWVRMLTCSSGTCARSPYSPVPGGHPAELKMRDRTLVRHCLLTGYLLPVTQWCNAR